MGGIRTFFAQRSNLIAIALLAAFALRMLVPSGWMPSVDEAGLTRITLCTGTGVSDAWLDSKGGLHKSDPDQKKQADSPCAFAGLGAAFDLVDQPEPELRSVLLATGAWHAPQPASIGQGLAAPPPPSTGPPVLS
jgi:hypothetical protein